MTKKLAVCSTVSTSEYATNVETTPLITNCICARSICAHAWWWERGGMRRARARVRASGLRRPVHLIGKHQRGKGRQRRARLVQQVRRLLVAPGAVLRARAARAARAPQQLGQAREQLAAPRQPGVDLRVKQLQQRAQLALLRAAERRGRDDVRPVRRAAEGLHRVQAHARGGAVGRGPGGGGRCVSHQGADRAFPCASGRAWVACNACAPSPRPPPAHPAAGGLATLMTRKWPISRARQLHSASPAAGALAALLRSLRCVVRAHAERSRRHALAPAPRAAGSAGQTLPRPTTPRPRVAHLQSSTPRSAHKLRDARRREERGAARRGRGHRRLEAAALAQHAPRPTRAQTRRTAARRSPRPRRPAARRGRRRAATRWGRRRPAARRRAAAGPRAAHASCRRGASSCRMQPRRASSCSGRTPGSPPATRERRRRRRRPQPRPPPCAAARSRR